MSNIRPMVSNIIGKVCLFQIKVTQYNTSHGCEEYTITRVLTDATSEATKARPAIEADASKVGGHSDAEPSKRTAHPTTATEVQASTNGNKRPKTG